METIGAIAPAFRKKILSINKVFARYEQHERRLKVMPTQRNRSRSTSHALHVSCCVLVQARRISAEFVHLRDLSARQLRFALSR